MHIKLAPGIPHSVQQLGLRASCAGDSIDITPLFLPAKLSLVHLNNSFYMQSLQQYAAWNSAYCCVVHQLMCRKTNKTNPKHSSALSLLPTSPLLKCSRDTTLSCSFSLTVGKSHIWGSSLGAQLFPEVLPTSPLRSSFSSDSHLFLTD